MLNTCTESKAGIAGIFAAIQNVGIKLSQFKSTSHLNLSFQGKTDFDLLADPRDAQSLKMLLLQLGFKQRYATPEAIFPGMEDYLWYDPVTEAIHHFHIHYRLIFGEANAKNHWFENTAGLLAISEFNPDFGLWIVPPSFELLLLILRILLKFNPEQKMAGKKSYSVPKSLRAEVDDLLSRVSLSLLQEVISVWAPWAEATLEVFLVKYQSKGLTFETMRMLRRDLLNALGPLQRTTAENAAGMKALRKSVKSVPGLPTRWLPSGGKTIALVGSDGSGKTTLSKELTDWLGYKLSARSLYLGQNKERLKPVRKSLWKKLLPIKTLPKEQLHLQFARDRLNNIEQGCHFAGQGCFVIYDRYPLKEFWTMALPMDGPRLKPDDQDYETERALYRKIPDYPDVLIILKTDLETVLTRKPENRSEKILPLVQAKVEAVQKLSVQPPSGPICLVIDANRDYDTVRRDIKRQLWDVL
jgi:thymidylate kinase